MHAEIMLGITADGAVSKDTAGLHRFLNLGGKPGTSPEGVSRTSAPSFTLIKKPVINGLRICRQKKQAGFWLHTLYVGYWL